MLLVVALNTHLALEIHLFKNTFLMSIDLRFQLLVIMIDSDVFKVSFGDYFLKAFRLSSSKPRATKGAFSFDPLSVCFTKQTQQTEIHF